MRLGASSWCFRMEPIVQALENISILGIEYVELFANKFHLDPRLQEADVSGLASCLRDTDLNPLSLHMPFAGIQSGGSEFSAKMMWMNLVEDCLHIVEELKIPAIVIHPQILASDDSGKSVVLDIVNVAQEQLIPKADSLGIRVLFENLPSSLYPAYWRSSHFQELFDTAKHQEIGICFDISHCICSGLDPISEIRSCLCRVQAIHLSDNIAQSKADLHLPVYQGQTDWASFFAFLKEESFEGDIILEIDGGKDAVTGVRDSVRVIREMIRDC